MEVQVNNVVDKKKIQPLKVQKWLERLVFYICLYVFGIITIYPMIWMFYSSLKSNQDIMMNTFSLPTTMHFENYVNAWQTAKIGVYFFNSVWVTLISIIATILIGAIAAFILAKFKFKLRQLIYSSFIIGLLIPVHTVLVPLFIQMRSLRLLNSLWSLVLTYTAFGLPITVFILESFIRAFPDSIIEAAVMDGCSVARIFYGIIMPMAKPAITTVAILNFLNHWKEFSFALIFLTDEAKKTLPIGLYNFVGAYTRDYAQMMAALVISSIPIIIIYLVLQEHVIKGMTAGAVKG
ncbi:MAG: sugar transporter permease [Clostridia bacterium]|jgi:raffinose/stachyose/melibiose transport system permease protein|nr:sugar transporter permease [Clostridia bacterium]